MLIEFCVFEFDGFVNDFDVGGVYVFLYFVYVVYGEGLGVEFVVWWMWWIWR